MGYKTPRFQFAHLIEGARHNIVRVNEALSMADAAVGVIEVVDITGTNTPPGSPTVGDCYLIGDTPTDEWADETEGTLAVYVTGGWRFLDISARVAMIYDLATDRLMLKTPNQALFATLPLDLDSGASLTPYWTGTFTSDGRPIMRQRVVFSSMGSGAGTYNTAHSISSVDLDTIMIQGRAKTATQTHMMPTAVFSVYADATNVNLVAASDPAGWTVDLFIDYAESA